MGTTTSKVKTASREYKKKVEPLIRANHKHALLLKDSSPNVISIVLAHACLLTIEQARLFQIWDHYADAVVDACSERTDELVETEEIVSTDWQSHLGKGQFVNYFDDEIVRLLYDYEALMREYLKYDELVQGLLAKNGLGVKLLAAGVILQSKECVTQGLGAAAAYYEAVELPTSEELSEGDVTTERDEIIEETLASQTTDLSILNELVVLESIAMMYPYMPSKLFAKLWTYQCDRLSTPPEQQTLAKGQTLDMKKINPDHIPIVRLLREYPEHGTSIAANLQ